MEIFRSKLSRPSALHVDKALRNPIKMPGESGFAGAVKSSNPFLRFITSAIEFLTVERKQYILSCIHI